MAVATKALDRALAALYARERPAKVMAAVTGGGVSAAELLFRSGSSSTMLGFAVPYARASLLQFLGDSSDATATRAATKYCSAEMAERMAEAAWKQALELTRQEDEGAADLASAFTSFQSAVGVGCTAALATNYSKKGPHEAFVSVCRATLSVGAEAVAPSWDTYHLTLDKAIGRSRAEEDGIVGKWVVYALARAAQGDAAECEALYNALVGDHVGEDALHTVKSAKESTTADVLDGICGETAHGSLSSVCFVPGLLTAGSVVATRGFAFRGIVLPGSFNPLHVGHVELARAAQRKVAALTGRLLPIGFEMAVANADKGAIAASTVRERVEQFGPHSTLGLGEWPVLVTNAPLFGQKAELLCDCVFVIGADTAVRLVDRKYYEQDEHRMVVALQRIADRGCSFVVAGRFDDKQTRRFISADEVLERHVPPVFRRLFVPLGEADYRNDISSTLLRQRAAASETDAAGGGGDGGGVQ